MRNRNSRDTDTRDLETEIKGCIANVGVALVAIINIHLETLIYGRHRYEKHRYEKNRYERYRHERHREKKKGILHKYRRCAHQHPPRERLRYMRDIDERQKLRDICTRETDMRDIQTGKGADTDMRDIQTKKKGILHKGRHRAHQYPPQAHVVLVLVCSARRSETLLISLLLMPC